MKPNGKEAAEAPNLDLRKLLRALQAVRDGDFSVRLASDQTGLAGKVADTFNDRFLQYTAIRSTTDYGRADRTLVLIGVANTGGTVLAGFIAITGVLNTTLLSFFERTREFGLLRSIGWARRRVQALVLGDASLVGVHRARTTATTRRARQGRPARSVASTTTRAAKIPTVQPSRDAR